MSLAVSELTGARERRLEVLVVAFGSPEPLDTSLAALEGAFPVVVVDNSSSPGTAAVARAHHARYVDSGGNVGFAAGVNLGLAATTVGSDVLLLNPDAAIRGADVRRLQHVLLASSDLACVAPAQHPP
ncbi:MAG: glycosyltransferase family 2 protein, partial [Acidimicrobiales bacterium]